MMPRMAVRPDRRQQISLLSARQVSGDWPWAHALVTDIPAESCALDPLDITTQFPLYCDPLARPRAQQPTLFDDIAEPAELRVRLGPAGQAIAERETETPWQAPPPPDDADTSLQARVHRILRRAAMETDAGRPDEEPSICTGCSRPLAACGCAPR